MDELVETWELRQIIRQEELMENVETKAEEEKRGGGGHVVRGDADDLIDHERIPRQ